MYQDLFKAEGEFYSRKNILVDSIIDICLVYTGVNDTAQYVRADFYIYHLELIVKALL